MSSSGPLAYIKTKNSLRKKEKIHRMKSAIVDKIHRDIDISQLKANQHVNEELIVFVCCCAEELIKKKYNVDKKEFVVDVLQTIFGSLNNAEIEQVKSQIEFAHENKLIKKVKFTYKAGVVIWDWVCRKLL
jgi:hypothetical protein